MAETRVEIIISGRDAAQLVRDLPGRLPPGASITAASAKAAAGPSLLARAAAAAPALPAAFARWWHGAMAAPGPGPVTMLLVTALAMVLLYAIERAAVARLPEALRAPPRRPRSYARRFTAALRWAAVTAVRLSLFAALAAGIVTAFGGPAGPMTPLGLALLSAVMHFRVIYAVLDFLVAPAEPGRRVAGFSDDEARHIERAARILLVVITLTGFLRAVIMGVVAAGAAGAFWSITLRALEGLMGFWFFLAVRRPVSRLLLDNIAAGARAGIRPGVLGRLAARFWYLLYLPLIVLAVAANGYEDLSERELTASAASQYSFMIFVLAPFLVGGLKIWRDLRLKKAKPDARGQVMGLFTFLEGLVIVLAALLVMMAWDINPFEVEATGGGRLLPRLVTAGMVLVAGIALWRTAAAFLDVYAPETESREGGVPEGEAGRAGSRYETVFPVLRVSAGFLIWTLTILIALSMLGVDIAPLLASAGIIGLAVGFGAQTLVRDVISGMFYLWEDAFRIGEYIETAEGKGIVEKILLRSVRLRHHRGALHTIPFGSIGTITNHSRDWVKIKFTFEVAPTTDLERLRKVIKKLGQQLAEEPELKGKFIEPLKAQGAIGMAGPNYVIGVKFTTRPGEQFIIRRRVFAALQKTLRESGIEVSAQRVIVDTRGGPAPSPEAVAAAAKAAVDAAGTSKS